MQVFYHVVGRDNAAQDFPKTVHARKPIQAVLDSLSPENTAHLRDQLWTHFPGGTFNCWGVPEGADPVIRKLEAGDAVLLVETVGYGGRVPALAEVRCYWHRPLPSVSEALWGDSRFPFIFFFDTEPLTMTWEDLHRDLGFNDKYRPPPHFHSVKSERLAATRWGGAEGFIAHVRQAYAATPVPYRPRANALRRLIREPGEEYSGAVDGEIDDIVRASQSAIPQLTDALERVTRTSVVPPRYAAFRTRILDLYDFRCAVCRSRLHSPGGLAEAEAAHIYPKRLDGSDDLRNGICLCRRHHWAFDAGWFTLTDDLRVWVASGMPDDVHFDFIREYDGVAISGPAAPEFTPHPLFLGAHRRLHGFE